MKREADYAGMGLSLRGGNDRRTAVPIRAAEAIQEVERKQLQNGSRESLDPGTPRGGRNPAAVSVTAMEWGLLPSRGGNHGTNPEQFLNRK